jgi:hypothetical protein
MIVRIADTLAQEDAQDLCKTFNILQTKNVQ